MNNVSPSKTGLFYGLISGLGCFALFLLIYFIHKNPFGAWSWLGFWIPILLMILGTKAHRDKDLEGYITYGRAIAVSMLVAFSGAMVYEVLTFAFTTFIGDSVVTMHIDDSAAKIEQARPFLNEKMYQKALTALEEMKTNHMQALSQIIMSDFLWKIIGGFLVSLVVAALVKRNSPAEVADNSESNPS